MRKCIKSCINGKWQLGLNYRRTCFCMLCFFALCGLSRLTFSSLDIVSNKQNHIFRDFSHFSLNLLHLLLLLFCRCFFAENKSYFRFDFLALHKFCPKNYELRRALLLCFECDIFFRLFFKFIFLRQGH